MEKAGLFNLDMILNCLYGILFQIRPKNVSNIEFQITMVFLFFFFGGGGGGGGGCITK